MDKKSNKKIKIFKIITLILIIAIVIIISIWLIPIIKNISTQEGQLEFKNKIQNSGILGFFMLLGLQLAQIIIAIIPGEPLEIIAGMCYGPVGGTLFILFSAFLCSSIIFFAVRKLGRNFVCEFFDTKKIEKIEKSKIFNNPKTFQRILFILFLVPGTPKDLITYIAGLFPIEPLKFILIATFGRIPSIVSSTIAGAYLIEGKWQVSILAYGITFLVVGISALLYKLLAKDAEAEEAFKTIK